MGKILLVCGGGFSSSLLISKTKNACLNRNMSKEVDAMGSYVLMDSLYGNSPSETTKQYMEDVEVILVAPQIRGVSAKAQSYFDQHFHLPLAYIPGKEYAFADGEKILDLALDTIEKYQNKSGNK